VRLRDIRLIYASLLLNGPFSIVLATGRGIMGLNDRIKLRPMTAGRQGAVLAMASEESAMRLLCPDPEATWQPEGGEPVLGLVKGEKSLWA
jgi:glutamate synthase domain-containing protein 1